MFVDGEDGGLLEVGGLVRGYELEGLVEEKIAIERMKSASVCYPSMTVIVGNMCACRYPQMLPLLTQSCAKR
jgi:hypothetical protein